MATDKRHFLCLRCYHLPRKVFKIVAATATTGAALHLRTEHTIDEHGNHIKSSLKRPSKFESFQSEKRARSEGSHCRPIDLEQFKKALLKWQVLDQVSLRKATSPNLHELIQLLNPEAANLHYSSHNSLRQDVVEQFQKSKETIKGYLAKAKNKITLSFDIWTSRNKLPLLGICAHYIDHNCELQVVLLALPAIRGSHSRANMAPLILRVIEDFSIRDKLGFYMADNHGANDKALDMLKSSIPSIHPQKNRLWCLGHIINLVSQAILFGTDRDALQQASQTLEDIDESVEQFMATI
jgi:hypothetical protein